MTVREMEISSAEPQAMVHYCIFDLDGTLADCTHRLHHVQKDKPDWTAFYEAMDEDKPIQAMVLLARSLKFALRDPLEVIIATGRPSNYAERTAKWLAKNGLGFTKVIMRDEGDHRPSPIVKQEMWGQLEAAYRCAPLLVFDDRDADVKMWRKAGLICLQCAEGKY